jgi:hypothetical protein
VTPADVYFVQREEILNRKKGGKTATICARLYYNPGRTSDQSWGELEGNCSRVKGTG